MMGTWPGLSAHGRVPDSPTFGGFGTFLGWYNLGGTFAHKTSASFAKEATCLLEAVRRKDERWQDRVASKI